MTCHYLKKCTIVLIIFVQSSIKLNKNHSIDYNTVLDIQTQIKMPDFEAVIYRFGTSLYHTEGDDAQLRPNVQEEGRFKTNTYLNKSSRTGSLYYVWAKNQRVIPVGNVLFTSQTDLKSYCKDNNLRLGTTHFLTALRSDSAYTGHR